MSNTPDPTQTPQGPAYEGRLLDHPEDDVVDQGAAFDITTILSRRGVLAVAGLGAGAVILAACTPGSSSGSSASSASPSASSSGSATPTESAAASDAASSVLTVDGEIPDETAGPYPGDGSNGPDVLEQSGIVRADITSNIDGSASAEGVPLTFSLQIVDMAGGNVPFAGVAVYAWHCDAGGLYSMYSDGLEDATYLRGVQVTDSDGIVTFTSIFPACYLGRWPHIHFEVYPSVDDITDATNAISTSQIALPEDVCTAVYALDAYAGSTSNMAQVSLDTDNVFGEDGGALQMATVSGDVSGGYIASLVVGVDTATEPTSGDAPSGGGSSGGGAPPAN